jgi:hypothetical protein
MFKYYLVDVLASKSYQNTRITLGMVVSFCNCELASVTLLSVERRGVCKIA